MRCLDIIGRTSPPSLEEKSILHLVLLAAGVLLPSMYRNHQMYGFTIDLYKQYSVAVFVHPNSLSKPFTRQPEITTLTLVCMSHVWCLAHVWCTLTGKGGAYEAARRDNHHRRWVGGQLSILGFQYALFIDDEAWWQIPATADQQISHWTQPKQNTANLQLSSSGCPLRVIL